MECITGELVGHINISVYKTNDGHNLFQLQADNEDILPVLYVIEDILKIY